MMVSVAAWLFTKAETANVASAKVQGAYSTIDLMWAIRNVRLPLAKQSLIQAMPKIETTAIMPAVNTLDRAISAALTLAGNRMNAPNESIMMTWTTVVIGIAPLPTRGRNWGNSASRMIVRMPPK